MAEPVDEGREVMAIRPWESLAGMSGPAERCTCSEAQLSLVGCDCPANQNMPVRCHVRSCGRFLRTNPEIYNGVCNGCLTGYRTGYGIEDAVPVPEWQEYDDSDGPEPAKPDLWVGPEFADEISLEERWEHYAFEERNGMSYGSSF
jgi:hypothetical protein